MDARSSLPNTVALAWKQLCSKDVQRFVLPPSAFLHPLKRNGKSGERAEAMFGAGFASGRECVMKLTPCTVIQIGQVTEEQLELREVRVHSDKLYSTPLFSSFVPRLSSLAVLPLEADQRTAVNRHRRWKGPDGVKYSWQATQEGDLKVS